VIEIGADAIVIGATEVLIISVCTLAYLVARLFKKG